MSSGSPQKGFEMTTVRYSLILNGNIAGIPEIRTAVYALRDKGYDLAVKVTWEGADMQRLIKESIIAGADRIIIGGGDGSLNEAVTALMHLQSDYSLPEITALPLGTANDLQPLVKSPPPSLKHLTLQ
jgi:diacylglycerol kinase family enzyme